MAYFDPSMVTSPKNKVTQVSVIVDKGENSWAIAEVVWEKEACIGIRWNGGGTNGVGTPQSRGVPTWFILPSEVAKIVRDNIGDLKE